MGGAATACSATHVPGSCTGTVEEATSGSALLVVAKPTQNPTDEDDQIRVHLESMGFSVVRVAEEDPAPVPDDYDLVVMSPSLNSSVLVQNKYDLTTAPLLCMDGGSFDKLKMTSVPGSGTSVLDAKIALPPASPLAAGLSGLIATHDSPHPTQSFSHDVARPYGSAMVVASLPGFAKGEVVFAYSVGAGTAPGFFVPGLRVGFPRGFDRYTPETLRLFDAAVEWLTRPRPEVLLITTKGANTKNALHAAGYGVTLHNGAGLSESDAAGKSLVFVQSWSPGADISVLRDLAVPMLVDNETAFLAQRLSLASTSGTYSTSDLDIVEPLHPLSAHLSDTVAVTAGTTLSVWGTPAPSAVIAAAIPGGSPAVFGYEAGAEMVMGVVARERRVGLWLRNVAVPALKPDGQALFDAALEWAAQSDADGDGLGYSDEIVYGTDPQNPDTNGDGVLDGAAVDSGISPTLEDMDGDGLTNVEEAAIGTDPFLWDTDGDGINDKNDCYPLDPDNNVCPNDPTPGIPPVITLIEPAIPPSSIEPPL